MPIYQYVCGNKKCGDVYESFFLKMTGNEEKIAALKCPKCKSKKKTRKMSEFGFSFNQPQGTDKWNNDHDYRFYSNLPKVKAEREHAANHAKAKKKTGLQGVDPYNKIDDLNKPGAFGDVK